MLREQNGHLAEFLTTDPKGKLLPDYFSTVANQLVAEQTELVTEMNSVGQNIEHIKEIVAMQQTYAKVSGAYENLSAVELAEDALRINAAAFDRHRIHVVREFDETTPLVLCGPAQGVANSHQPDSATPSMPWTRIPPTKIGLSSGSDRRLLTG